MRLGLICHFLGYFLFLLLLSTTIFDHWDVLHLNSCNLILWVIWIWIMVVMELAFSPVWTFTSLSLLGRLYNISLETHLHNLSLYLRCHTTHCILLSCWLKSFLCLQCLLLSQLFIHPNVYLFWTWFFLWSRSCHLVPHHLSERILFITRTFFGFTEFKEFLWFLLLIFLLLLSKLA